MPSNHLCLCPSAFCLQRGGAVEVVVVVVVVVGGAAGGTSGAGVSLFGTGFTAGGAGGGTADGLDESVS